MEASTNDNKGKDGEHVGGQWKEKIEKDPFNFEVYNEVIRELKGRDNFEEVRQIRNYMKENLALSPEMWREWIMDEQGNSVVNEAEEDKVNTIIELYKQAIDMYTADYQLAFDYLNFVESINQELIEKLEQKYEKCGKEWVDTEWIQILYQFERNYTDGHKLWNKYIERKIQENTQEGGKIEEIHSMILERIQIPHQQIEETFSIYSMFVTQYMEDTYEETMVEVNQLKTITKERCLKRDQYEFELGGDDMEKRLSTFHKYVEYLEKEGGKESFMEITNLCERMIVHFGSNPKFWVFYLGIMNKNGVSEEDLMVYKAHKRSCLFVPLSGELRGLYLIYKFLNVDTVEEGVRYFEYVVNNRILIHSVDEMAQFLVSRLTAGRFMYSQELITQEEFRELCKTCYSIICKWFYKTPDPQFRVEKYIIFVEQAILENIEAAKDWWTTGCKINKHNIEYWINCAEFMKTYVSIEETRKVFEHALMTIKKAAQRGVEKYNESSHSFLMSCSRVFDAMIQLEYNLGDMNSIYCSNLSIESCRTELSKYYAYVNYYYYFYQQEQQEQQQNAVGASEEEGGNSGQSKKRKRESFETSEIKPRKYITYYVSNLPKGTTQMQIKELFEKTGTVSSVKFSNKAGGGLSSGSGFCYVKMMFEQDDNNQQSEAVISELNGTEIIPGFPIVVQFSAENKQANNPADSQLQADPNQHNTIITISNLNPSTELQKLQDFIKQKLIESDEKNNDTYNKIALSPEKPDPNDPFSRSASFTLPSSSSAAILSVLNLSGVEFDGRSLTLKSNNKQLDLINSSTTARITGFNKSTKIEKFTEIISEIGEIKRIHRNNQGTKIFVDMTSSNDAIKVVRKLNQSRIDDFTITASLTSSELSGSNTNRPKYTSFSNRSFNSRSNSRYDPKPKPKPKMLMTPRSVASRPSKP